MLSRQSFRGDAVTLPQSRRTAASDGPEGLGTGATPPLSGRRRPSPAQKAARRTPHAGADELTGVLARQRLGLNGVAPGIGRLAPGALVAGRYRIQSLLGRGGMGEVYAAHDVMLKEDIALKTLLLSANDDPQAALSLMTETRIGRKIGHPNVCRIHDVGTHEEQGQAEAFFYFMTMELIEGERLSRRLQHGPLRWREARAVAVQLLLGLGAMHAAGVLHRDLKSDNVMLTTSRPEARAVIMDFGLSCWLRAPGARQEASDCAGSLAYMAPEQLEGRALSVQTDVFAFGVVLFEMLTGTLPFAPEGDTAQETALSRRRQCSTVPSEWQPGLPAALDQLVLTCLRPRASERYSDTRRALRALASILA
jgi:serine/threonine protein kinase